MNLPETAALNLALGSRYAELSTSCCSLSCGAAFELAEVREGEVFVDLGCGRGQDVIRAAGRVGSTGLAVGIDMNEAMLAKARASAPTVLGNVRFLRGDLASFDLAPSSVDVLISNCTINHARDKTAVYREIHRVLRGGGRFIVSDVVAHEELPSDVRADPEAWARCYGGAILEAQNLAAMREGGFDDVTVLSRSDPYEKGGVLVRSLTFKGRRGGSAA